MRDNEPVTAESLGFDRKRLERVVRRIDSDIESGITDGCSIIVGRKGEVALRSVRGFADRDAGRTLTENDVFATMSLGKQFTFVTALTFVDRGSLHLHMHVSELIPEFRLFGLGQITLFHLLTHTSGIESESPRLPLETYLDIEKLAAYAASRRPESRAGEKVSYSTMIAPAVVAEMVLRADGRKRSFAQIVDEELFQPLGMKNTSLGPRADLNERLCPIKTKFGPGGMVGPELAETVSVMLATKGELAAGGYLTTIEDVHRFATMLRNGGELNGVRVLSPRLLEYCAQNFTGDKQNELWDYTRDTKGWQPWPASMGIGFWMR